MKNFNEKRQKIPRNSGVYIFKDKNGKIIYVGKALNLQSRVNSYFSKITDIKTAALVKKINDIQYITTSNETEALLLENNLIKEHKPKYNIQLKDAKSYPMLKITRESIPRIVKCREKYNDTDEYFGPFISVQAIKILQIFFSKVLKLRTCRKKFKPPYNYVPCLNYHIGRCSAPCASYISIEDYLKNIDKARSILKGETGKILESLEKKMALHSEKLEYENAAKIRDEIKIIKEFCSIQYIDNQSGDNSDYVGIYNDFETASVSIIQERRGKVIGKENFIVKNIIDYKEIMADFLSSYYLNITQIPQNIYISDELDEGAIIENALKIKNNSTVRILKPEEPKNRRILILAKENAEIFFEEDLYKLEKKDTLRELKKIFLLSKLPRVIEGIDIATLDGKFNTGALVSFRDGIADKKNYRQYNIENKDNPDDYAMMRELAERRYSKLKEKKELPDLILVDGGRGQVSAVMEIMNRLEAGITVVGLAKKDEHIFTYESSVPLILPKNSNALKLLQKIRDEAHRFSNTRLKNRYSKKTLESSLLAIKGLGRKRINELFKKFGSIKGLMNADAGEISSKTGLGTELADRIYKELH